MKSSLKPANKSNLEVFRIEHLSEKENGIVFAGPYDFSGVTEVESWCDESTDCHGGKKHPCVFTDVVMEHDLPNSWRKELYCGFTSIKQLKKWFSKSEIRRLKDLGFVISKYSPTMVFEGKKQCLFKTNTERTLVDFKEVYK